MLEPSLSPRNLYTDLRIKLVSFAPFGPGKVHEGVVDSAAGPGLYVVIQPFPMVKGWKILSPWTYMQLS